MFFRKREAAQEPFKQRKREEIDHEEWDKKKIIITLFFAVVAILAALEIKGTFFPSDTSVLGEKTQPTPIKKPDIKPPDFNVASEVGSTINEIKKNIEGLNPEEVATTSPQIQKVLQDIQGIKDLPTNQAREMCLKICSGI